MGNSTTHTTSDNGTNRMAQLKPESHFYIEGSDFAQTPSQAFGPIDATKFQTTASVTVSGSKKVYAICKGTVLIQPNSDNPNKVNLILRPFTQPIKGLAIKYFIYRGLNKADFVGSDDTVPNNNNTEYQTRVWDDFNRFYANDTDGQPQFLASYIGYDPSRPDTDLLPPLFFKVATTTTNEQGEEVEDTAIAYELPVLPAGAHLGHADGELGLDIVLDHGNYLTPSDLDPDFTGFKLNLAYARAQKFTLDTATVTTEAEQQLLRENCTRFVDAAAYWGLHAEIGKITTGGASGSVITTADDVYTNCVANYHTSNRFYLYIQANRQRSYNFYGNYYIYNNDGSFSNKSLRIGLDINNLSEIAFDTRDSWPIASYELPNTVGENKNIILELVTDGNEQVGLFCKIGQILSVNEKNFLSQRELRIEPNSDNESPQFTQPIALSIPYSESTFLSCFNYIIYQGKRNNSVYHLEEQAPILPNKFIDNVFYLPNASSLTNNGYLNFTCESLIDYNQAGMELSKTVTQVSRIIDLTQVNGSELSRVTYIASANDVKNEANASKTISSDLSKVNIFRKNGEEFRIPGLRKSYAQLEVVTIEQEPIKIGRLEMPDRAFPNKLILGLTSEEHNQLIELIDVPNTKTSIHFFSKDDLLYTQYDEIEYNRPYWSYKLGICIEDFDSNITSVFFPENPITVYSSDKFIYLSKDYAESLEYYAELSDLLTIERFEL